jgi:mannosyltransferase OCH1-like enzyme
MYSTGPLFFSALWVQYLWSLWGNGDPMDRVKVLVPGTGYADSYGFFKNVQGGSWHTRDTEVIFWMGRYWGLVTMMGLGVALGVTSMVWWLLKIVGKRCRYRRVHEKRGRYELWIEKGRYDY